MKPTPFPPSKSYAKWMLAFLFLCISIIPHPIQAHPVPDEKDCDFKKFNERFIFIPTHLANFKTGDEITLPLKKNNSRQGKYSFDNCNWGGGFFTFGITFNELQNCWTIHYSQNCTDKRGTRISLNETEMMVTLLGYYLLNREIHASTESCAGGISPQHMNPSTNFNWARFIDFLKCFKAYYEKCKADPKRSLEAEYLKKYLSAMLGAKIFTLDEALKNKDILSVHVPPPPTTPDELSKLSTSLKSIKAAVDAGGEIKIP